MPTRLHQSGSGSSRVPVGAKYVDSVLQIKAVKAKDSNWSGQPFQHKFTRNNELYKTNSVPSGKKVKIYGRIEEIKGKDGKLKFQSGTMWGHTNGNVSINSNKGRYLIVGKRPQWDMFSYPAGSNSNSRRNPMRRRRRNRGLSINPWYGDSGGHRLAALMRHGIIRRGKIKRHRKRHRGRPKLRYKYRVRHRRVKHRKRYRRVKHRVRHRVKHRRVKHRKRYRRAKHRAKRRRTYRTHKRRTRAYSRSLGDKRTKRYKRALSGYDAYSTPSRGFLESRMLHGRQSNPSRRRRRYKMARRRHRRYKKNPISLPSFGGYNLAKGIEPALLIGSSIMMSSVAVGYLQSRQWITIDASWKRYGIQIGAGLAGAVVLSKFLKKPQWAQYWGLGSLVAVAADLLATYILPSINSALAPAGTVAPTVAGLRGRGMGAFPRNARGIRGSSLGAFPTGNNAYNSSPYEASNQYASPYR